MPKHFINTPISAETRLIQVEGELAHHLLHVLRMKIGEPVTLCDGHLTDYDCVIEQIVPKGSTAALGKGVSVVAAASANGVSTPVSSGKKRSVVAASAKGPSIILSITAVRRCDTEPATKIYLFQALPKGDKLEWIIQKCVELGVHAIVPLITERSVVRVNKDWHTKTERYRRIAESAAAQSLRGIIPVVHDPVPFITALDGSRQGSRECSLMDSLAIPPIDLHLFVYEKERQVTIPQALRGLRSASVALWIGPEGGFSDEEASSFPMNGTQVADARADGVRSTTVTLGRRILRTETAGMAALTQVLCALEDIL